jgi:DNA-binding NarL/FixJ family response regulator
LSGQPGPRYPILVVDDVRDERAAVSQILEGAGYATRSAASGEAALNCAASEPLTLVVLDICLPGISGYQVCNELKDQFGDALPILFVSAARTESHDRVACLLVGGDDFLAKPVAPDELLIRVSRLIRHSRPMAQSVVTRLTPRELEVLRLLAEGVGPLEVADRLVISRKTVATHVDHILSKLGVHSRAQAVAMALRHDMLESPSVEARGG